LDDNLRKMIVGASIGALLGATVAFIHGRLVAPAPDEARNGAVAERSLDGGRLFKLGVGIVTVLRQLSEL
jgi:hypothetical protein